MKISTKGRYALTVLVDLARHSESGFVSLADIAERENLSRYFIDRFSLSAISAREGEPVNEIP